MRPSGQSPASRRPRPGARRPRRAGLALLGALLSLAAGAPAGAPERSPLRVGTSADYAPFSHASGDAPEGLDVAVARAWARDRGRSLELVRFRWPNLLRDLQAGRFDVAMSGITIRPERSAVGRFSVPVAETGAVALVRDAARFRTLEHLDEPEVRIAVNAGGHLERIAEARFTRATRVAIPDNAGVIRALVAGSVDAALSDSAEAERWRAEHPGLEALGPFTRDRKAYLLRAELAELAVDLDAWLLEAERSGRLGRLRAEHLGEEVPRTAEPLATTLAAIDERLSLMPLVAKAKLREGRPVEDPERERAVLDAALAAASAAAADRKRAPPPEAGLRALYGAQIEAAKRIQLAALRRPEQLSALPDLSLDGQLRPALGRIGERIARLLPELPPDLSRAEVGRVAREQLRAPGLDPTSLTAIAEALWQLAREDSSARHEADQQAGGRSEQQAGAVAQGGEAPAQDGNLPGDQPVHGQ